MVTKKLFRFLVPEFNLTIIQGLWIWSVTMNYVKDGEKLCLRELDIPWDQVQHNLYNFFIFNYIVSNFVIFLHQIYIFKSQLMHIQYVFHAINTKFFVFWAIGGDRIESILFLVKCVGSKFIFFA